MKAHFLYVPSTKLGYGRMGVKLAAALKTAGVDINNTLDEGQDWRANVASWAAVPSHLRGNFDSQYLTILTMWEATRLPEAMRENLDHLDMVMVPSQQNVELFSDYHPNVKYVPLGIAPEDWHYQCRPIVEPEFRFLVGGSGPRKGVDLVAKAFYRLWGKPGSWRGPTPVLIFKSPTGKIVGPEGDDLPFVRDRTRIISGHLTDAEEVELYAYAHCYLQPSRGEGFGLQPLQAIAQGLPTILTAAHGHASFAHLGIPLHSTPTPAAYFSHGFAGDWWEPDLDELCDTMRWVYENYDEAQADARLSAATVATDFTWAQTAEQWIAAHGDTLEQEYAGRGEWVVPAPTLFPVITNVRWRGNVGGIDYDIPYNTETWVPADVKRLLFEGHRLDPGCLVDTRALTESQLLKVGEHIARDAYCPTCLQRLNSQPTRSDDLYAEMT